ISFSFNPPLQPVTTLFPYTTLFRSILEQRHRRNAVPFGIVQDSRGQGLSVAEVLPEFWRGPREQENTSKETVIHIVDFIPQLVRSEEHTSELQSRFDLVCRLLLEKK